MLAATQTFEYEGMTYTVNSDGTCTLTKGLDISEVFIPVYAWNEMFHSYTVTAIGPSAFKGCTELSKVIFGNYDAEDAGHFICTIENQVKTIEYYAFYGCKSLTQIEWPSHLKTIEHHAFENSGLENVYIPSSVTTIGSGAFYTANALKSLDLTDCIDNCDINLAPFKINNNTHIELRYPTYGKLYNQIKNNLIYYFPYVHRYSTDTVEYHPNVTFYRAGEIVTPPVLTTSMDDYYIQSQDANTIKFHNLFANQIYKFWLDFNGKADFMVELCTSTIDVKFNIISQCANECTIKATNASAYYQDYYISNTFWTINNDTKSYDGDILTFHRTSSSNTLKYNLTDGRTTQTETYNYTFPTLTISNESATATSLSSARLSCDANLSDGTVMEIEWRRVDAPDVVESNVAECPVVNQKMLGELRGLKDDVYYKFRPRYKLEGNTSYTYGQWKGFYTGDAGVYFAPEVNTLAPVCNSEGAVTLTGYAVAGTDNITSRGFEYRITSSTPSRADNWTSIQANGTYMTVTLSDLPKGATFLCCAFAQVADGTRYYGDEQTFTTPGASEITEIASEQQKLSVRLYENPVTTQPSVKISSSKEGAEALCSIYSINGALMHQQTVIADGNYSTLDVNLKPGMYILNVIADGERENLRMIVR